MTTTTDAVTTRDFTPRGHCTKCGAGYREFIGCEEPDCCWWPDGFEQAIRAAAERVKT